MSKLISVLVAVLIIAVSAIYAMPSTGRIRAGAGDIAMIECQDHECKVGCRTLHKIPTDHCTTPPFRHDEGMKVMCNAAPANELCYYMSIFRKNDSITNGAYCTDADLQNNEYHKCDECHPSHHHDGTFEMTTGCNSSATMTLNFECNEGCKVCNQTHHVTDKQCDVPKNFKDAVMFSAPTRCTQQILYLHYNNSECDGQGELPPFPDFANVCYSMMGRSHMYHCQ